MTAMKTGAATNGGKSGISREIGIIPAWAYILAAFVFVGIPFCFMFLVWPSAEGPDQPGQFFRILFPLVPATFLAFLALMTGYVNRDAGKRGMSRTLWTLIVILVPNAIGFIIYFLLRNPIVAHCPKCGARIDASGNFCQHCGYSFHPTCPQCKRAVHKGDTFCGTCGLQLEPAK